MKTCPRVFTRWIDKGDLDDISIIEKASFTDPWSKNDFCNCLNRKNCAAVVAEMSGKVVSFMLFELLSRRVQLINMAVLPKNRRCKAASCMLKWVIDKLITGKDCLVVAAVRESNLAAQLFFKSVGFRAEQILPNYYEDTGEDAYEFQRMVKSEN